MALILSLCNQGSCTWAAAEFVLQGVCIVQSLTNSIFYLSIALFLKIKYQFGNNNNFYFYAIIISRGCSCTAGRSGCGLTKSPLLNMMAPITGREVTRGQSGVKGSSAPDIR